MDRDVARFLAKYGFPGTPAGDRMATDLEALLDDTVDHYKEFG